MNVREEVRDWIDDNTVGSVFRWEQLFDTKSIWLGKKIHQIDTNNKRFKTTDEVRIC